MCTSVIAGLLLAGAALELLGLGLVAWDVWDARRQRDELTNRRDALIQPGPAMAHSRAPGEITVEGGSPPPVPPLKERVDRLESELGAFRARLDRDAEEHVRQHREMLDRVAEWVAEARREVFDAKQNLRPVIGAAAAGNVRRRALGVVLFALGLMVQTIGNIAAL